MNGSGNTSTDPSNNTSCYLVLKSESTPVPPPNGCFQLTLIPGRFTLADTSVRFLPTTFINNRNENTDTASEDHSTSSFYHISSSDLFSSSTKTPPTSTPSTLNVLNAIPSLYDPIWSRALCTPSSQPFLNRYTLDLSYSSLSVNGNFFNHRYSSQLICRQNHFREL